MRRRGKEKEIKGKGEIRRRRGNENKMKEDEEGIRWKNKKEMKR